MHNVKSKTWIANHTGTQSHCTTHYFNNRNTERGNKNLEEEVKESQRPMASLEFFRPVERKITLGSWGTAGQRKNTADQYTVPAWYQRYAYALISYTSSRQRHLVLYGTERAVLSFLVLSRVWSIPTEQEPHRKKNWWCMARIFICALSMDSSENTKLGSNNNYQHISFPLHQFTDLQVW